MVRPKTRAEAKSDTRRRLFDAAVRRFREDGFAATSLAAIAADAGVTKGAVYANWPSKHALFVEMMQDVNPPLVDLSAFSDTSLSLEERFAAFGRTAMSDMDLAGDIANKLEMLAFALRDAASGDAWTGLYRRVSEPLGKEVDDNVAAAGATTVISGEQIALTIQALIDGFAPLRILMPEIVTDEMIGEVTRVLVHLFQSEDQST